MPKNILRYKTGQNWLAIGLFSALVVMSFVVRACLVKFANPDALAFGEWYQFVQAHGIHSFQSTFTNYSPPYSYFLYIAAVLHLSMMTAVKALPWLFDGILAVSVYQLVQAIRPHKYLPMSAALVVLFVPTVLFTGVFWGQVDQLYTAFLLLSLAAGLKRNSRWAWAFFGVAFACKLQAVFFLPVIGILSFKRIRWYDAVWAFGAYLILTLPPMLAGRSLGSLLSIYPDQAKLYSGELTLNAPNVYQWVPNSLFDYLNNAGIALAVVAVLGIALFALVNRRYSSKDLLLVTTLVLYVVPFLLPAMHERYFFPASLASVLLCIVYPSVLNFSSAVVMQLVVLFSYMPFLLNVQPPIAMPILSVFVLVIICGLVAQYIHLPLTTRVERPAELIQ